MTRMADGSEGPNGIVKLVDPQVTAKAKRRRFTAEFKRRILREADALTETGGIGEMLRREGLVRPNDERTRRCGAVAASVDRADAERGKPSGLRFV
jgi:hypothetical protein